MGWILCIVGLCLIIFGSLFFENLLHNKLGITKIRGIATKDGIDNLFWILGFILIAVTIIVALFGWWPEDEVRAIDLPAENVIVSEDRSALEETVLVDSEQFFKLKESGGQVFLSGKIHNEDLVYFIQQETTGLVFEYRETVDRSFFKKTGSFHGIEDGKALVYVGKENILLGIIYAVLCLVSGALLFLAIYVIPWNGK